MLYSYNNDAVLTYYLGRYDEFAFVIMAALL